MTIKSLISMEQIQTIVALTKKGEFRKRIAAQVGVANMTVYKYQKRLGLI